MKYQTKCPYLLTRIDQTQFCAYWDNNANVNENNTPDAPCLKGKKCDG